MKKYLLALCCIVVLIAAACTQQTRVQTATNNQDTPVSKQTAEQPAASKTQQEISADVKELLAKSKTKVSSIYYKYKGPETGDNFYEFYVKGARIKYKPALETKSLDNPDSYDSVFIDMIGLTARSYCEATYCTYKGKKADLSYGNAYIKTPLDWISGLSKANKAGEEVIDSRSTWKLDTSSGILWVDTFYGIPLKVESSGKTYRFQQISVNSVQDADVTPSS